MESLLAAVPRDQLALLESSNMVVINRKTDDGSICSIGLSFNAVRYKQVISLNRPALEIARLQNYSNASCHSRLDIIRMLSKQGFTCASHPAPKAWYPDGPLCFTASIVGASKLYWLCLLLRDEIVARGAPCILHKAPAAYYKALLSLGDLSPFSSLQDMEGGDEAKIGPALAPVLQLMDDKALLKPLLDLHEGDSIDDDAYDLNDDNADVAGSDSIQDMTLFPIMDKGLGHRMELESFHDPSISPCFVHFDHCSHSSGLLRAYIKCPRHRRCFKYTQVVTQGGRSQAIAFCLGWALWGQQEVPLREDHSGHEPPNHIVQSVLARL